MKKKTIWSLALALALVVSAIGAGGRSYSDFTSRIKMDLIHIFPGPFAKASHFAP